MLWFALAIGTVVGLFVAQLVHLSLVLTWEADRVRGLGYYGLPPAARARFKRRLYRHAAMLSPTILVLSRFSKWSFPRVSFRQGGIAGPRGTCSPESFAAGMAYTPRAEDVFVVTPMRCGTTWMQHLVFEVLNRGAGDLASSGRTLYGISPWLEALVGVPVAEAPLVGAERPARVIKSHFPAAVCPFDRRARYIYVTRHPIACYASCVDFIAVNAGPFAPAPERIEEWFCSEQWMWWGTWPAHVSGWWERAHTHDNVLLLTFEDLKRDLPAVAQRVAGFLGLSPLTGAEVQQVTARCSFDFMRRHGDTFEMHPPHILAPEPALFTRGAADRHRDVDAERRARLGRWCAAALWGSAFPLDELFPDVASGGGEGA